MNTHQHCCQVTGRTSSGTFRLDVLSNNTDAWTCTVSKQNPQSFLKHQTASHYQNISTGNWFCKNFGMAYEPITVDSSSTDAPSMAQWLDPNELLGRNAWKLESFYLKKMRNSLKSVIYTVHLFLRSLFRRLQSSGKPMLRDCVPPVSTSLVSSQTIRRFSGSGISMCGDLFLIFLAGCLALKDFLLMNIVWCIKPNLQRLELENIFRPGCLGAIF